MSHNTTNQATPDVLPLDVLIRVRAERTESARLRLERQVEQHLRQTSEHPPVDSPVSLENPSPQTQDAEPTASTIPAQSQTAAPSFELNRVQGAAIFLLMLLIVFLLL